MKYIILDWFLNCFVLEARKHCNSIGLDPNCKILLILDNCSAHPKAECLIKDNVFVSYLPPNCTSLLQPQDNGIIRSMKCKYRTILMRRLVTAVNEGIPVQDFIKKFNIKDAVYCVANAWNSIKPSTLKNGWFNIWPNLRSASNSNEDPARLAGFRMSKEKKRIQELIDYIKDVTNPNAKDLAAKLNEDNLIEWMRVDETVPTVYHYTDTEILDLVRNSGTNSSTSSDEDESTDENEENVRERISIGRLISITTELLTGLEQRSFISEQEIMNIYLLQDKLIQERPKLVKQQTLDDVFKKITNEQKKTAMVSTLDNPRPSTSNQPDIIIISDEND